ncbi:CDP-alcohol phosphatidyltransferase family protein [Luteolibacter algae]|uniref:CDP-diacylglycerol--glycerol-3-phosphate 3-phosphatidyltransferase n=1 Tax=Luteolibacter algae TaxID=454151 RepID=A0ABW5DA70_9BACT
MTFATKITVCRILLVPVFSVLAIRYGMSTHSGAPEAIYRWWALAVFITAAVSDGVDGWIARKFDQRSDLGAYLDPLADKALVTSAILVLTFYDWGASGWRLPIWFTIIVLLRDAIILAGIRYLTARKLTVKIIPHWTGKICTVSLFVVLGWMMLGPIPLSPIYPCTFAGLFIVLSMWSYIRQGWNILHPPASSGGR